METGIFQKQTGTWYDTSQEEPERSRRWLLWGSFGGVAGLGLAFLLGFLGGHAPVDGLEQQTTALAHELRTTKQQEQFLLVTRRCSTYDREIGEVEQLIHAGKTGVAGALVSVYLHDTARPACPQTQVELGALAYNATMDGLFQNAQPDSLDHTPLLTWRSSERQADALGVPASERLSPLSVAAQAYTDHLWELARAAFHQAWKEELIGPGDLSQVSLYFAILRNEGDLLLRAGSAGGRHQGAVLLRTGDAIAQAYALRRGECRADLERFVGPNEALWPAADRADPVLAARNAG